MIRAVLDANVVVAAMLAPHGTPGQAVAAVNTAYTLVWSPPAVVECLRVAGYPRLAGRFRVKDPVAFVAHLAAAAELVETPLPDVQVARGDRSDDVYVATALVGAAGWIVTGDKRHLQAVREFAGIRIVSPSGFLEEIARRQKSGDG